MERRRPLRFFVFLFSIVIVFYGVVSEAPHTDEDSGFRFAKAVPAWALPDFQATGSALGASPGESFCFACYLGPLAVSTPSHPVTPAPVLLARIERMAPVTVEGESFTVPSRSRGPPLFSL